jgi:hypothetical protein
MRAIARAATASSPGSRAHASGGQKNQINQENRLTEAADERKSVGASERMDEEKPTERYRGEIRNTFILLK